MLVFADCPHCSSLYSLLRRITKVGHPDCTRLSPFTCKLVKGIVQWLVIFAQLSILGMSFIALASMGNSVYNQYSFLTIGSMLFGAATIFVTSIMTFAIATQNRFFTTVKYSGYVCLCAWDDDVHYQLSERH